MAKIKLSGEKLTKHFTLKDYSKNQTGTIPMTRPRCCTRRCWKNSGRG